MGFPLDKSQKGAACISHLDLSCTRIGVVCCAKMNLVDCPWMQINLGPNSVVDLRVLSLLYTIPVCLFRLLPGRLHPICCAPAANGVLDKKILTGDSPPYHTHIMC